MESLEILSNLFNFQNILAVTAGVFIGILIGMLPGLTANLGVALLLPVTYGLEPTSALLLLVSVYTSAIYGGSFPAILINAPGTSASAATALDGYVLTKKGQFNTAIRVSTFASVFGGIVSGYQFITTMSGCVGLFMIGLLTNSLGTQQLGNILAAILTTGYIGGALAWRKLKQ